MRSTLRTLAVAVVALAGLVACGEPAAGTPLTATVTWSRAAQARGLINVVLANPSDRPVQVATIALDDARFAPRSPTERLVTVAAGVERLLVPIALGAARCIGVLGTPQVVAGGAPVPIDDAGRRVLDGIVDDACDRAAVERSASMAFTDDVRVVSDVAVDLVLRLERRGGSRRVTIDAVGSNVIFTTSSDQLPATLGPDDDVLDVPVRLSAERCEPHALAETKKTYQLPAWVALDGSEPSFVELTVSGVARDALDRALNEGCAAGA